MRHINIIYLAKTTARSCISCADVKVTQLYSGTLRNGHPSTADTHDIADNSESPESPSIHFYT